MSTTTPTEIPSTETEPSTALPLAYRCSRCFQTRCSTVDRAGQAEDCDLCGHKNTVPEATADRISQGETFLQQAATGAVNQINLTNEPPQLSTAEIMKQCRQKTIAKHGVSGLVASRSKRLLGSWVDSFVLLLAIILGFVVAAYAANAVGAPAPGEEPTPEYLAVLFSSLLIFPVVLQIAQFVMTAKHGRTIGKYCLNTKIINKHGNPPGFLSGVVMRYWVNALLCSLPFYSLINSIWIFTNDSNHCIHDVLAGTSVIDAS